MRRLTSIPPANRRRQTNLDRLSSMRAATRIGLTRVGGQVGSFSHQRLAEDQFTPRVIAPDPGIREMRREFRAAIARQVARFEALCQAAEDAAEAAIWQAQVDRLKDFA